MISTHQDIDLSYKTTKLLKLFVRANATCQGLAQFTWKKTHKFQLDTY